VSSLLANSSVLCCPFIAALLLISSSYAASNRNESTAWKQGKFNIDTAGVVARSDIVLERPNTQPEQAMPLGNGRLGIAVWAQDGLTIQLNRADTLPLRLSPGQVIIPGLTRLVSAPDYNARVNLYNGEFTERGDGMTATVFVQPDSDVAIVDVTGADPSATQTVDLHLWSPRHPQVEQQGAFGALSELWTDSKEAGASGKTFGSLAAITARARNVHTESSGSAAVKLSFLPESDGSFRILIAAPEWAGGNALETVHSLLSPGSNASPSEHRRWWHEFWNQAGLMKLSSPDHSAEYFENLRLIDLFTAAAESRGSIPGSQAGIGDLFSSARDHHQWGPSAYWHWNLRMQVAANLGAGLFSLNEPYFRLYKDNLPNIEAWTRSRMQDRPGACVPETMRFNGQGIENETWTKSPGLDCDAASPPYYNARTISTGAEVSLWIWRQYLATADRKFLAANYPVMAASARFLLAYGRTGADGLLHTFPSNAHENQWDVHDPTTDISAMKAFFPALIDAARILNADPDLVQQVEGALRKIPELPRTDSATLKQQLTAAHDASGQDVIAQSYDQSAPVHNTENLGLEPVWPYSLIGDAGPLHDLAVRTYNYRPNKAQNDWSYDPIQAARLGLAAEVKSSLIQLTTKYQAYPSGLANFVGPEFYAEQIGVVAAALQEALVQDYDGLIRIAPAWPKDWDADGTVYIERNSKVHVQMHHGEPVTVVLESGFSGEVRVRNPWPGRAVAVVSGDDNRSIHADVSGAVLTFQVQPGTSYVLERRDVPLAKLLFAPVNGTPALLPKFLASRSIGLSREQRK
jgi:alpha-L-fucosidase 2